MQAMSRAADCPMLRKTGHAVTLRLPQAATQHRAPQDALMAHVIHCDVPLSWPEDYAGLPFPLPASVQRSALKRRLEFCLGRLAARAALADWGLAHHVVDVGPDREPLWPEGIVGSISHVSDTAIAVAAPVQRALRVGIDIETVIDRSIAATLARQVLTPEERQLLELTEFDAGFAPRLTLAFSAKESLFKALFPSVRSFFGFEAARITAWDPEQSSLALELQQTLAPGLQQGRRFEVGFRWLSPTQVLTAVVE